MKIDKRIVVGTPALILMLPFLLVGYVWYWVQLYAAAGYEMAEVVYEWLEEKLGD